MRHFPRMGTTQLRRRINDVTPSDWIRIGLLGAALIGWLVMLFFDPVSNETTRITAVVGAVAIGFLIGVVNVATPARLLLRVLGPLWRAILLVVLWIVVSFFLMVGATEFLIPAAHERIPLVTLTVMLVILGMLAYLIAPLIPAQPVSHLSSTNPFEGLKIKSYPSYLFIRFGGLFYGLGYTGFLILMLGLATVDPVGFTL